MTTIQNRCGRAAALAALLLAPLMAFAVAILPASAMADPPGDPMDPHGAGEMHQRMHEFMQQRMQKHLDHLAARLEIRASQQPAWNAFAGAVRGMLPDKPFERPKADVDAATRARTMADRASEHARKLGQLADATAKLEQALDANQKQVFDEAARHFGEHMHGMHRMHGVHGDHCGGMHEGPRHQHEHEDDDMHGPMHGHDRSDAGRPDSPWSAWHDEAAEADAAME